MEKSFLKQEEINNSIIVEGITLKVSDDGDVLINDKSIESVEECKQALAIIIKAMVYTVKIFK